MQMNEWTDNAIMMLLKQGNDGPQYWTGPRTYWWGLVDLVGPTAYEDL